jgi:uncharacterized protein
MSAAVQSADRLRLLEFSQPRILREHRSHCQDIALKLHLSGSDAAHSFSGYGAGYVEVNGRRYAHSLIVAPDVPVETWPVLTWPALVSGHFARLVELAPALVLLGSGAHQRFPHPSITRALTEARIALEVMDTRAACRTYNILAAEGRSVAAAVIVEAASAPD